MRGIDRAMRKMAKSIPILLMFAIACTLICLPTITKACDRSCAQVVTPGFSFLVSAPVVQQYVAPAPIVQHYVAPAQVVQKQEAPAAIVQKYVASVPVVQFQSTGHASAAVVSTTVQRGPGLLARLAALRAANLERRADVAAIRAANLAAASSSVTVTRQRIVAVH